MTENEKLREKAQEFNEEYFDGRIPLGTINFRVSKRMTTTRGMYSSRKEISMSALLMESDVEWNKTLLHEMVHAYQHLVNGEKPNHGRTFKNLSTHIQRKSRGKYNVTRTNGFEDEKVAEKVQTIRERKTAENTHYVVYKKTYNGTMRYNFAKNLSRWEVAELQSMDYTVGITDDSLMKVRTCKNANYVKRARYYYDDKVIKDLGITWKAI